MSRENLKTFLLEVEEIEDKDENDGSYCAIIVVGKFLLEPEPDQFAALSFDDTNGDTWDTLGCWLERMNSVTKIEASDDKGVKFSGLKGLNVLPLNSLESVDGSLAIMANPDLTSLVRAASPGRQPVPLNHSVLLLDHSHSVTPLNHFVVLLLLPQVNLMPSYKNF